MGKVFKDTSALIEADFSRRQEVALATGVTLLRSPTGSGKTLTIGRALEGAERSLYGVFPSDMNKEELVFARLLDRDQTGTVVWWLRNQSQARWAVSIVLPNGERHFPDFVVGVDQRRKSEDHIALAEVRDDGKTGRLFSDRNIEKVRTEHARYRSCLMVFRTEQGEWSNVAYRPELQRHQAGSKFKVDDLARIY
jgi:hypothetical protein